MVITANIAMTPPATMLDTRWLATAIRDGRRKARPQPHRDHREQMVDADSGCWTPAASPISARDRDAAAAGRAAASSAAKVQMRGAERAILLP